MKTTLLNILFFFIVLTALFTSIILITGFPKEGYELIAFLILVVIFYGLWAVTSVSEIMDEINKGK